MRYYIVAGEASGDLHASNLMKGIYAQDPDANIRFWGGEMMRKVYEAHPTPDGGLVHDYKAGAVMGIFELVGKLGKLISNIRSCEKDIAAFSPDALILVDYPGFNLRIAKWAHRHGFKVFYFIVPKVWASREGRIRALKRYVDHLLIVFPFEKSYFDSKNVPYIYCGNPLVDEITPTPYGERSTRTIALLAGSRLHEVRSMMPLYNEVVRILTSKPQFADYKFIVAGAPGRKEADYGDYDCDRISIEFGRTHEILRSADAAVINSGTASLEAVLIGTPQVVAFIVPSKITYYLAKYFLLKCKFISLGNLCLDRLAFKELYTYEDCTAENIATEVERLLTDKPYRDRMLDDYELIRKELGESGACERAARAIIENSL